MEALEPYVPTSDDPFDRRKAAHLGRRAAFGFREPELAECLAAGPARAIDRLLDPPADGGAAFAELLAQLDGQLLDLAKEEDLQAWWIYRMLRSNDPLREKLTLFWHGHFATSLRKVELASRMRTQNETLRAHALGPFGDLLLAVGKDPAMLVWLDNRTNRKGRPNENWAREVMELFTLGVGNYGEQDVKEAARAFTGWHLRGEKFFFDASQHDGGEKTVLGVTGNLDGGDVVRILLEQEACARFLCARLYRFFVGPDPDPEVVAELAARLRASGYSVRVVVETLLRSRLFFSPASYRARIKSPVEFALGIVGALDVRADCRGIARSLREMGQTLFAPPTVKGWDGERAWLSAQWLVARANVAMAACALRGGPAESRFLPLPLLERRAARGTPGEVVDALAEVLLDGPVEDAVRDRLAQYATRNDRGAELKWNPKDDALVETKARGIAHLLMTLPEYQLA
jgi:hypothetical protein